MPQQFRLSLDVIKFNEQGLVPAIIQDYLDGVVLMFAWMNRESLQKTLETGRTWFYSRSRQALWPKGETSGHVQWVRWWRYDCDHDALLIGVEQVGDIACHKGERSCFHLIDEPHAPAHLPPGDMVAQLYEVICQRRDQPQEGSYTSHLFTGGDNRILKKLGEETAELIMACKDREPEAIASECADVLYHTLVALAAYQVPWRAVLQELQRRRR
ncbi:bifunctional phosphoribosyl-AMP cyclohydrolase/phosphoribosyl-ATP diphosphatase HisIE [Synechococcus sp. C9]|uniref:bifunctional phosphoribosyl-AMP cyclohydrolase/phosphoribosyl-ATP diphosphatase HisIE n=1 Tax=Synechococcus sp. C9 TaxID=102119 RepID=UPI001FF21859|nr:bifunctional phosphoribosyl-AMP cyclohydrolase/phosphoribosyl-ATP diphosphatase HisIE [Synechococcus sp. C9]